MAYFTPTQQWIRDLWSMGSQNSQGNQMGVMAPQLSMPPMSAPSRPQPAPQMPEQEESPIARGLSAGMGAGRQSLDMDAKQREQAMGLMMFHMFSGLGGKNPTIMGSLSDGLTAGMPHLQQERANIAKLNAMEQERQDMMTNEMQRQKEHTQQRADLQSHRREMMDYRKQKMDGGNAVADAENQDSVPLSRMPKVAQSGAVKEMRERVSTGMPLKDVLGTLDQMQKLSDENPHLGNSMALAYFSEKDGKGLNKVLKNVALGKDRAAVEKFGKLTNVLLQKQIKSMKGPVTDRLKRILTESTPSAGMTKDSIDYLIKSTREESLPYYEDAVNARKGLLKQTYVPMKLQEYNAQSETSGGNADAEKIKQALDAGYSQEEIDAIMQEQ